MELSAAMAASAQGELEDKMVTIKPSSESIGTVPICNASAQHTANALKYKYICACLKYYNSAEHCNLLFVLHLADA